MKTILRKTLSMFLALSLLGSLAPAAAASDALGEDLTARDTLLNQDTQLSTNVFWSTAYSDLRTENIITYSPNDDVTPIVTFGDTLTSRTTVSTAAKELESQGYRVVAGINGDFFNTSNGLPIGILVSDGQLLSSDGGYYAVGFKEDGSAVIGKPGVTVTADLGYELVDSSNYATEVVRTIAGVNKARVSSGGIYLYTYDFNDRHTIGTNEAGVDVLCSIEDGDLAIGSSLTLTVERVIESSGTATSVGRDQVVLSANAQASTYYTDALRNIPAGAEITITVTAADEAWNDVVYAAGALYSLLGKRGRAVGPALRRKSPHRHRREGGRHRGLLHHRRPPVRPFHRRQPQPGGPAPGGAGLCDRRRPGRRRLHHHHGNPA